MVRNWNDRRSFLKSQLILGAGVLATGTTFPESGAYRNRDVDADVSSPDSLRANYQNFPGDPFPEPTPLNLNVRETRQKSGYRIESLTCEVQPGDRVPALLLVPDKVTAASPAPGIAVWHQHNGQYYLGKSEPAGVIFADWY